MDSSASPLPASSHLSPSTTWLSAILPSLVGSLAMVLLPQPLGPHPNLVFMAELISKQ